MALPRRTMLSLVFPVVMVVLVVGISTFNHPVSTPRHTESGSARMTSCRSTASLNDAQLEQCLSAEVLTLRASIAREQDRAMATLNRQLPSQAHQLISVAAARFSNYVRSECRAEAALASGGTLYPILYGECEVTLYRQRLNTLRSSGSLTG